MKLSESFISQLKNQKFLAPIEQFVGSGIPFFFSVDNIKYVITSGFCEAHAHFREPGFSYKESIKTGSLAAARGGYTTVFTMPNVNPVPDGLENLNVQLDLIKKDAVIEVIPYGSITKCELGKELSDMEEMKDLVCAYSDDGRGVQNPEMMKTAMLKAKWLDKLIVAHCEDNSLLFGGYIHGGEYAKLHNHKGISSASEYSQVIRDIELVRKTGVGYHVCHVSTLESVDAVRKAKAEGLNVSCETAPHYLVMTDADLSEDGNFKMNPPVRSKADQKALIDGIEDGVIEIIATDHAPHSEEEKSRGLEKSPFGIVGLETAFPILYTEFVKTGRWTIEKLTDLLSNNPRKRFNLTKRANDFTIFEVEKPYKIDSREFLSKGKNTPFNGREVYGKCKLTVYNGKIVYQD